MPWTDLTFGAGSVLTGTKMTQLDENFDALAGQNAGAPLVFFPNSGTYGAHVFSLATVHAESGFVAPEVSSLATVHAGSGFVGPEVSSFGAITVTDSFVLQSVSRNESGYTYLPNGIILQWLLSDSVSGVESVALPLTFPNSVFNVTAALLGTGTTRLCNVASYGRDFVSVKKFTVAEGNTAHRAFIQAIGW